MFEKEAEERTKQYMDKHTEKYNCECTKLETDNYNTGREYGYEDGFQDGAEFGYKKANEWHYVRDGLPKVSGRYWVYTGGEPFTLDFDTEVNAFGYWCLDVGVNLGVRDSIFETVSERDEDAVIAWKEIVLPELKESE